MRDLTKLSIEQLMRDYHEAMHTAHNAAHPTQLLEQQAIAMALLAEAERRDQLNVDGELFNLLYRTGKVGTIYHPDATDIKYGTYIYRFENRRLIRVTRR